MSYVMPTNWSQNITSMYSLFQYVQYVSNDSFFLFVLFGIFIITFIILKMGFTNSRAFAGSSFLFMILSIILRTLGFISNKWMYLGIIFVALSLVWLHLENAG